MKTKKQPIKRAAYSLNEVAEMVGKDRSWIYRMVKAGKVQVIKGLGSQMISAVEVERITGTNPRQ